MTTNRKSSKKAKNASFHMDAKTIRLSDTTSFKKSFLKKRLGSKNEKRPVVYSYKDNRIRNGLC